MNNEKKLQARHLFYQTELSKSQISTVLGISRRALHYWIKEGNWERLKHSATHLPSLLAENCYHIIGHLTTHYLSERRLTSPVTLKEAETLHKLTMTVSKLKNRTTLNENMEMFAYFIDDVKKQNPDLAVQIAPYIERYVGDRASVYARDVMPENFTAMGRTPFMEETNFEEQQLDAQDILAWDNERLDAEENERAAAQKGQPAAVVGLPDEYLKVLSKIPLEPQPAKEDHTELKTVTTELQISNQRFPDLPSDAYITSISSEMHTPIPNSQFPTPSPADLSAAAEALANEEQLEIPLSENDGISQITNTTSQIPEVRNTAQEMRKIEQELRKKYSVAA